MSVTAAPLNIPYAETRLGIAMTDLAALQRAIALLFHTAHLPAYQQRVDAGAGPIARHRSGSFGVFMGYDFHLTPSGPKLIEINTNAGGALLNGLRSLELCHRDAVDWMCCDPPPVPDVEERLIETFRSEWRAAMGPSAPPLRSIAIADDAPSQQFLYPEFELFADLFRRHDIAAVICDSRDLRCRSDGGIAAGDTPIDLVYWRDTDFYLATPRAAALRQAYLAGRVAVTPSPREHHLLADKGRLQVLGSSQELIDLGASAEDAAFVADIIPPTLPLAELGLERAWRERRKWVFKPAAAYGSKAVYRGDKISRTRLEEIAAQGGFLAQERVEPGLTPLTTPEGTTQMKFDIRAYAYRDQILLLGARVYQGQVTNLRTPGGGFSAICIARERR